GRAADQLCKFIVPVMGMVRVQACGSQALARIVARQSHRLAAAVQVTTGDNESCDVGLCGTFNDAFAVVVETVMCEIGADIDHGSLDCRVVSGAGQCNPRFGFLFRLLVPCGSCFATISGFSGPGPVAP